jgi:hypothetical protein
MPRSLSREPFEHTATPSPEETAVRYMLPRGGTRNAMVYRSYHFLPQYFRRVVKVRAPS